MDEKPQNIKPSERIEQIWLSKEYDYRDPCGAMNCQCYENSRMIESILEYLDEKNN